MPVIGLDLSLTGTGMVVLDDQGDVLHASTIKTKTNGMERLLQIKHVIMQQYDVHAPTITCIEGYSMGSRSGQAFSIGELGGVIRLMLHQWQRPYKDVAPTSLKKFVTGKGSAMKDEVMMHVFKRWGWEAGDNNQADAYGLARIAWHLEHGNQGLIAPQLEVMKGIK